MENERRFAGISPFMLVVSAGVAAKIAIHLLTASNYGFFCDELYTIALSRHLAFGYVDLPPLVPALVALTRLVLGESLFALHVVPALAGAGTLILVCLITREMGGKLAATAAAALGVLIAPVWLILDSFFCYDSIDQLLLAAFLFFLVRLVRTGNVKLWLVLGITAGAACMTKDTILFLGPGLLIALIATPRRRDLIARSFSFLYRPIKDFNVPKSDYPQEFSNRIGWDELVEQVAHVYNGLSAEEKKSVGIWADWYGPAGAIDLFGPKYGLPPAVSGHMSYHLWGPGQQSWDVMIFVTGAMDFFGRFYQDVELKTVIQNDFAMPYNRISIYVCRGVIRSPATFWSELKSY
jgi:hypothetical protein